MIPKLNITLAATSLSCYTHDETGVTLYPSDFFGDVTRLARDLSIDYAVWDHGDGTFSKSLSSTHRYTNPGKYIASLIVYDNEGQQYRSSTSLTIDSHNYVSDKLTWINSGNVFNIPASTKKWYPFHLELFKSWQTWPSVSATGYSLTLNVSGSKSEKLNIHDYYNDKWSHLRNIWTFHRPITSGMEEIMLPIERYDLKDSTTKLYLNGTNLTSVSSKDAVFVGTSATASFYYYDETPANFTSKDDPLICFANIDTKEFNPEYNIGDGHPPITLDLAQTKPVAMPVRIRSSYSSQISINSTGLPSFSLPKIVYEGSKVPFFLCFSDEGNNAKENSYPPLTGQTDRVYNRTSDFYKVRLSILDSAGTPVSADFYSGGWDDTLPKEIPNYYRGYFIPRQSVDNCTIHAESYLVDKLTASREYYHSYFVSPILSSVFVMSRPDKRIKYDWPVDIGKVKIDIVDSKESDVGAHEIYPMCVTPDKSVIGTTFDRSFVYVGDGKSRKIHKLDYEGKRLATFDAVEKAVAKNFPPRINNKPASYTDNDPVVSRITSDRDSNLWVSLYDSISSFKLDGVTGDIMATVADIDFDNYFQRGTTYYSYSDTDTTEYKIGDIGKPVCIETDINSGPWVGYDTVSGSHISNYDHKGKFENKIHLNEGQFVYDLIVNNRDALWLSTYYDRSTRPTVKNLTDIIDDFVVYREDDLDYSTLKFKFICKDNTHANDLLSREGFDVIDVIDTPDHKINVQYLMKSRGEQFEQSEDPDIANNAGLSAHYDANYTDKTIKGESVFAAPTIVYKSDFANTQDGWSSGHGDRDFSNAYGDGPSMTFKPDSGNTVHYVWLANKLTVGQQYRLKTQIYIPHYSTGSSVRRVLIYGGQYIWDSAAHEMGNGPKGQVSGFPQKYDEWVDIDVTFTAKSTSLYFYTLGPAWVFAASASSKWYMHDVEITSSVNNGLLPDGDGLDWTGRGTIIQVEPGATGWSEDPVLRATATKDSEYHRVTCDLNGGDQPRIVSGKKYNITGRIYIPSGADTLERFQFRHGNGISHAFLPGEERTTYGSHIIKPNTDAWHDFEFEWTASDQNGAYEGWVEFWMGKDSATDTSETFAWAGNKNKGSNSLNQFGGGRDHFYLSNIKVKQIAPLNTTVNQKRNVISYKVRCHQSTYWHQFNELRSFPTSTNPDLLIRVRESDDIYRISGGGSTVQKRSGFLYPTYLTLDLNNNVWVTHSNNVISKIIDEPADLAGTYVFDQYIGETTSATASTYNTNLQFQNHDALTCSLNNDVYVLDNFHRKIYVINAETRSLVTSSNILPQEEDAAYEAQIKSNPDYVEGEQFSFYYQAIGDWNGIRYFHKFENNAISVKRLKGDHTLDISPASGKYHAYKLNENYDYETVFKSYATQPNVEDSDQIFEKFFGQGIGNATSHPASLGKKMYETTANFSRNHSDAETCNINSVNSLAKMGSVTIDNRNNYAYPGSLKRVMDLASIRKDTLWGSRDNFKRNFTGMTGIPKNIGEQLDVKKYMVTPGVPLVAHEQYSNQYLLIVPHFLENDFSVDLKNNKIEEFSYPLSSFNTLNGKEHNWNWSIMDSVTGDNIGNFYTFYEFIPTPSQFQTTGVIDWSNANTTVDEMSTTHVDWVKDNGVVDQMLEYELRKNLDLFSTDPYKHQVAAKPAYAVTDLNIIAAQGTSNIETIEFLQQQQTSYIPASGTIVAGRTISSGTTIAEQLQGEDYDGSDISLTNL